MKYFVYLRGYIVVFKHTTRELIFDGTIVDFNEIEILQVTQTKKKQQPLEEWEIFHKRKDWHICMFQ